MAVRLLSLLLAASTTRVIDAGQVLSKIAARPRPTVHGPADDSSHLEHEARRFEVALERLRHVPHRLDALKTVLGYLERARDHPRDVRARSVCLWEPAFRTYIAATDGGLQALQAAGFDVIEKDSRGTPFLVMRRLDTKAVRELIVQAKSELAVAEAAGGDGGSCEPTPAVGEGMLRADRRGALSISAAGESSSDGGDDGPREGDDTPSEVDEGAEATDAAETSEGHSGDSVEHALVQQISSMISGLIHELERQTSADRNGTQEAGGAGGGNATGSPPSPPVHFRVYRSPSFPGFPPGGGLPFLPGGLGGSVGGDGDEDGEVRLPQPLSTPHLHSPSPQPLSTAHPTAEHAPYRVRS